MALAVAWVSMWLMLTCQWVIPSRCAMASVSPLSLTCGWPAGVGRISMSVQEIPPDQPVPKTFRMASLAAKRPAKCS